MNRSPTLPESLVFLQALWHLEHALQAASKRMQATLGITSPQRIVVRILGSNPGLHPGQLARLVHDHPSTLTGVLQRLETRGLISRIVDTDDRRQAMLFLTEKGREVDTGREGTVEQAIIRALARVTPEQTAAAREVLRVLVEELEGVAAQPTRS
jgi:DNA-binding MarR family transcriptional regulator